MPHPVFSHVIRMLLEYIYVCMCVCVCGVFKIGPFCLPSLTHENTEIFYMAGHRYYNWV